MRVAASERNLRSSAHRCGSTMRPFLADGARDEEHLDRMHTAWLKAVVLNVAVWSQAYVRDDWY